MVFAPVSSLRSPVYLLEEEILSTIFSPKPRVWIIRFLGKFSSTLFSLRLHRTPPLLEVPYHRNSGLLWGPMENGVREIFVNKNSPEKKCQLRFPFPNG